MRMCFDRGVAPLLIAAVLAGCGSAPKSAAPVTEAGLQREAAPAANAKGPLLPPAGSGRGGYYQDDGPGDRVPDGLLATPDAEPKVEPYSKTGNRPYVVFGKTYTPITDQRPFKQRGPGSWYGKKFHGQKTSSGELYDMYKMSAAHPTLPIPSYARVTHVGSGKQVIVRVNDRGPFLSGRIIDLSYTAALKLGYIASGSAELEVERLLPDEIARIVGAAKEPAAAAEAGNAMDSIIASAAASQPEAALPTATGGVVPGFYLQLGAYGQAANAEAARLRLAQAGTLPAPQIVQQGSLYRLQSGPFASRSEADAAARQMQNAGAAKPVIVQR